MAKFQVKVFHRSTDRNIDRAWQPTDEPAQPVHTEVVDALTREEATIRLQKAYPRYTEHFGYSLTIDKIY